MRAVLLLLVLALPATALARDAPQFRVSTTLLAEGHTGHGDPAAAWNSRSGDELVVWDAVGDTGVETRAALLGTDGTLRATADRVLARDAVNPDVAYAAAPDRFLVVFDTVRERRVEVRGLLLGSGGEPLGEPFAIADGGPELLLERGRAAVAWDPAGGVFVVAYVRTLDQPPPSGDRRFGNTEIFLRRVAPDGAVIGAEVQASQSARANEPQGAEYPALAVDGRTGAALVAWSGPLSSRYERRVFAQLLDPHGVPVGEDIRVADGPALAPAAARDGQRWLIAYPALLEERQEVCARPTSSCDDPPRHAVGLTALGAGGARTMVLAPSRARATHGPRPAIAATGAGPVLVWAAREIRAALVDASGIGTPVRVSVTAAPGAPATPEAEWDAATGRLLVAWKAPPPGTDRQHGALFGRQFIPGRPFDAVPPGVRIARRPRRGRILITCREPCSIVPRTGHRFRLSGRPFGRRYRLRPHRASRVRVTVVATDRAGNPQRAARTVRMR